MKYFERFVSSFYFWNVVRNTLVFSLLRLLLGPTLAIMLALLLNEVRNLVFKRVAQTVSYLPHFISWVVVASLVHAILSVDGGLLNLIITGLGGDAVLFLATRVSSAHRPLHLDVARGGMGLDHLPCRDRRDRPRALRHGAGGVPVADVDIGAVQRELVESGAMLTFLNDGNPGDGDAVPTLQMLGVHGFFASYDARPAEPLDRAEAALWADGLADVRGGVNVADELARRILNCAPAGRGVTRAEWNELLLARGMPPERDGPESATSLTRAGAAGLAYRVLAR